MRAKLPFASWPDADQKLWIELTTRGHPLDPEGALSHLRLSTLHNTQVAYGRWLFWLKHAEPSALSEPPLPRITDRRVSAWMDACAPLAAYSRKMYLDEIIRVLKAGNAELPVHRLRRLRKLLNTEAQTTAGGRKIGRIPSSIDLIHTAADYAETGVDAAPSAFERTRRLRDSAMIAFLATMPIRRRNFAALELGRTISIGVDFVEVTLPPDEVKNARGLVFTLQEPAAALLRRYVAEARPFLAARNPQPTEFLWLADTGRPYALNYLTTRISQLTERLVGVKVPPHFFRDAVATTLTRASPELARGVPALLGHSNSRTSERHYNHARMVETGREFGDILKTIRATP